MEVNRWERGRLEIDRLLADGELEHVTADREVATSLLESATEHLRSAAMLIDTDLEGAYAILYDAARKACSALLEVQGLRATSRGGHIAVREAVIAQFGSATGGDPLRAFDRLRRRRNDTEYPGGASSLNREEVDEALDRATSIVEYANSLIAHLPVY